MSADDDKNALIEAAIEQAIARQRGNVPPAMLDEMRRTLRMIATSHPDAQAILRRLQHSKVHANVQQSGDVDVSATAGETAKDAKKKAEGEGT